MRILWTLVFLIAPAVPVAAQDAAIRADAAAAEAPRWLLTGYAGTLGIADGELDEVGMTTEASLLFGARLGHLFGPRWAIEGSYGHAGLDGTSEGFGEMDGRVHLYHADVVFLAPESGRAQVALSAGAGGIHYAYEEFERRGVLLQGESWAHEALVSFGAGLIVNLGSRAGIRIEARDLVQLCSAESEPIDETHDFSHCPLDDKVLHNPSLSGGALVRF